MQSNVWDKLIKCYNDFPSDFAGEVQDDVEIIESESKLKITFSDSYKKYIKLYGGGLFEGHFVYGLKRQRSMPDYNWSVIDKTNFYKLSQKWPGIDDWYIISDDGRGNPIGIDPDGKVWLSDHDSNFEKVKLAENFEEFLEKLLDDRLYE